MNRGTRQHQKALRRRARKAGKYVYPHRRAPKAQEPPDAAQEAGGLLQTFVEKLGLGKK